MTIAISLLITTFYNSYFYLLIIAYNNFTFTFQLLSLLLIVTVILLFNAAFYNCDSYNDYCYDHYKWWLFFHYLTTMIITYNGYFFFIYDSIL